MITWLQELNRWEWLGIYFVMCVVASIFIDAFIKTGKGPHNRRWYD